MYSDAAFFNAEMKTGFGFLLKEWFWIINFIRGGSGS